MVVTALVACGGAAPPEREFADRAAAASAGAVGPGELPELLPPSATGIRERTTIDTDERWVRFGFDAADLETFATACEEIPPLEAIHPRLSRTDRIPWWNRELRIASSRGRGGYRMYRCHRDEPGIRKPWSFLAVDPARGLGWYWELRHE